MRITTDPSRLKLPDSLRAQLAAFRGRVWTIKLIEAGCGAIIAVLVAFLATFALDRWFDTPGGLRLALLGAAALGCALLPLALYRWVWKRRRPDQLARLLSRRHPSFGDQLLGVIELVASTSEQARSRALCEAAIGQVAEVARKRDFGDAVPEPRHRRRAFFAGLAVLATSAVFAWVPDAATNAWARFSAPWSEIARYTFTRVEPLPERIVVAHGEPFEVKVRLAEASSWQPKDGEIRLDGQEWVTAALQDGEYRFALPQQIAAARLSVRIGDVRERILVEPTLRPELTSIVARVALPDYLERPELLTKDVRGGTISLVQGSRATLVATASRDLALARIDDQPASTVGATITSPPAQIAEALEVKFEWQDTLGLSGKEPFTLSIIGRADEPPSIACEDLPRQKVVLDSEVLTFRAKAQDDYGVKLVGIDWQGIDTESLVIPAKGERVLAAGGPEAELLEFEGTFSAKSLGIEPQPVHVRLFVEDLFPGRERVWSATYLLHILNAEQHAIWLTEQLAKWQRQSLEVRDRELQLFETNKLLRSMTAEELDRADTRRRIESQVAAERSNGRRLSNLVVSGEDLVRQAARNPEFGVGDLEKWAEMLQILKDISGNRMPSVADLLRQAAQSSLASGTPATQGPMAGQIRATGAAAPSSGSAPSAPKPAVPTIADIESSQQPPDNSPKPPSPAGNSSAKLGLAQTMLMGASKGGGNCPAAAALDEAVKAQHDLLAEFEKVADELNRILANLEGSTLVKRLKAASRLQNKIGGTLSEDVTDAFGVPEEVVETTHSRLFDDLTRQEVKSSSVVSTIMDDMLAYFERRRLVKFRNVLDDMRRHNVVGNLRQLGDELRVDTALAIAQTEYWSDNLDRWAEDLVDPASGGG
jgi:hypothetical protein